MECAVDAEYPMLLKLLSAVWCSLFAPLTVVVIVPFSCCDSIDQYPNDYRYNDIDIDIDIYSIAFLP
jgi:hypothetical protein